MEPIHPDHGGNGRLGVATEAGAIAPLPMWASWMIRLGEELSTRQDQDTRTWVAVTGPTRKLLACLAAGGAVRASVQDEVQDQVAHFEELATLSRGAPITWVGADGLLRSGTFLGTAVDDGVDCLVYRQRTYAGAGATTKRLRGHCQDVQPMSTGSEPFAGSRALAISPTFARAAASAPLPTLAARTALGVVLIGEATSLEVDLRSVDFATENAAGVQTGCLLDLVRPRRFLHKGAHFRSEVVPAVASELPDEVDEAATELTIFDGPHGFLRLRDAVASNLLLIVDRWAISSAEAVGEFMRERAMRSTEDAELKSGPPPPGLEAVAWREEW